MQLGKFEILEELGRGGFGIVYKARDMALDRLVALKILHPELLINHDFLRRFRQEARIAAQLDHPNLVPVYEFGESKGRYYIVMGYMAGGSLKELLKREGRLEPERAREVLGQISAGLTYAHRRGIIHRDLKPGNILFDGEGRARVSDMGFARLLGGESSLPMTGSGGIVGTPAYMAPEIWNGQPAVPATDVYSAACILVEMLTGKVLFEGDTTPMVMKKHFDPLRLPDGLPREWIPAIEQALEKEPEERTGAVEELVSGLRAQVPDEVDGGRQAQEEGEPEPEETGSGAGEQPPEEGEGETETAPGPQRPNRLAFYLMLGLLAVVAGCMLAGAASFLIISQTTKPIMPPETIKTIINTETPTLTRNTETPVPTRVATSTKIPTPTPRPSNTKTAASGSTYPKFTTGMCGNVKDNCISTWKNSTSSLEVLFNSSILQSGTFTLAINGSKFDCKPHKYISGQFVCTGPGQKINESLRLKIYDSRTNQEIASGSIILVVPTSKYGG